MNEPKLGQLITGEQHRDAVHIAIEPVVALCRLAPGQRVQLGDRDPKSGLLSIQNTVGDGVGIVDPYLAAPVQRHQRCWLFLYPNTVTSLRHSWTHPAFPDVIDHTMEQLATLDTAESSAWLQQFAKSNSMDYEDMLREASIAGCVIAGITFDSSDVPPEFWEHLSRVAGKKFDHAHITATEFSCSC